MNKSNSNNSVFGRREFLSKVTFTSAISLLGTSGIKGAFSDGNNSYHDHASATMPSIMLGKHRISRLVCGSNPLLGYSYLGQHTDNSLWPFNHDGAVAVQNIGEPS